MKKSIAVGLLIFSLSSFSFADGAYVNMQRAVGGIIQDAAVARGLSTTDPRTYGTLYGVGKAAVSGVAAAGTAAAVVGTAPAWGSVLAVAAISGAVSYGVSVAIDGVVKWVFGSNGSVTSSGASAVLDPNLLPGQCWSYPNYLADVCTASKEAVCSAIPKGTTSFYDEGGNVAYSTQIHEWDSSEQKCAYHWSPNPPGHPAVVMGYSPVVRNGTPTSTTPVSGSLSDVIASLDASTKAQKVSYDALAMMINQLAHQAAAQPGYAGIPLAVTANLVTPADVQKWAQANPAAYPTVADLVAPVSSPSTDLVPSSSAGSVVSPVTSETPSTSTNPVSNQPQLNLGADPVIGSPSLENTPTATSILQPLLNLFPDLRNFATPNHSAECPKPVFEVFGKSIVMDAQCTIAEQNRDTLYTIMTLCWAVVALLIILSA